MNTKLKLSIVGLLIAGNNILFSQSLADAIKLTTNEQYEKADAAFKNLLQNQGNSGEYLFYYGENFFKNDRPEKAKEQYQKAVEVNATNPFGYVGLGKIDWYIGKQTEAKAHFYKAITLAAGKNATVLMKIAEAYTQAEIKNLAEASALLTQATKLDPKNPEVYILMGDVYLEQNDGTNAINNYEKASAINPKYVQAILRQGQVWNRAKNYTLAIDTYKKAKNIDSTFAPAYREMAEIYLRAGMYGNAAYNAKRYLDLNNDCGTMGRYAGILFQAKQYKEAVAAASEAQKCDPNNVYLHRYLAFAQFESNDFANGIANCEAFFSKANEDVKIIPLDYEYYAKLLSKSKKDSLAIIQFKKALELQPDKIELNADIATCHRNLKQYADAIKYYNIKIDAGKAGANDYYGLGLSYYFSKDFVNADSAFSQIIKSNPNLGLGYLWRAKTNTQLDPKNEKWAAKTFYEDFLEKAKPEESKNNLVDANTYLGVYYMNNKDICTAKTFFKKVAELDPTNKNAKGFLDSAEAKKCP
ncbi:MAG: tetratricopeptide repeat protein [Bacteroidia bacterium]|nr:tetratricopeptide repeat protein [Bacteroidia bacterium]